MEEIGERLLSSSGYMDSVARVPRRARVRRTAAQRDLLRLPLGVLHAGLLPPALQVQVRHERVPAAGRVRACGRSKRRRGCECGWGVGGWRLLRGSRLAGSRSGPSERGPA